ncbi:hypothetical protein QE450_004252 [Paenibacillus sp. SORGH_AS306]|uniref:hypothetical protein n=1 Tax=unclassified Paenibacillus TaxID=185978 RepID=UPI002780C104|nr:MULTISPECIES: hypothetical protein [unclassified Paenibacillus]MDQ1236754.1 hypothetical protein [Paenibacillus sp. SORGH_AS_0306]MDR6109111.1 hypothetical protein [Paenibacillus sp. SORGH_AS_0338]
MDQKNQIIIPLKNENIIFNDVISLERGQLNSIVVSSIEKTGKEWRKQEKGINILLTPDQKKNILDFKNRVVAGLTAQELSENDYLDVQPHAKKRINYRLENHDPDVPLTKEILIKLAQAIIDAPKVLKAEWKGRPNLSYTFQSVYDNKSVKIALAFTDAIIVITVISSERGLKKDYGFSVKDIIRFKTKKRSSTKK